MKYVITLGLLLFSLTLWAQKPDMERMKRDIEVGENILATLLEEEYEVYPSHTLFIGNQRNVEGSYLEGFGILFSISSGRILRAIGRADRQSGRSQRNSSRGRGRSSQSIDGIAITVPDVRTRVSTGQASNWADTLDIESHFKEAVQSFAAEYAFLLRQLPSDEKIMIRYGGDQSRILSWGTNVHVDRPGAYSAVIEKSDVDEFQSGRINQNQLSQRIKFTTEEDEPSKKDRDLELLSGIFSRLYKSDLSANDLLKLRSSPNYEKIEGLGAVFDLSVGIKNSIWSVYNPLLQLNGGNEVDIIVGEEPENKSDDKDKTADEIDAAYPDFLSDLKNNIIEYGGIVKDLASDEALIFRVNFFDCKGCKVLPQKLEITAAQTTLDNYRKGKTNLSDAAGQLKITEEK